MTPRTLRALALVALVAALPAHADVRKAKKHYERGMAAYMLEQYDEAIRWFEEGFKEKPLAQFMFNIALAHEKAARYEEAAKYYQKFIEGWPDNKDRPDAERRLAAVRATLSAPPPPLELPKGAKLTAKSPAPPGSAASAVPRRVNLTISDSAPLEPSFMADEPAESGAEKKPRRWPIWVGVAVGAVVLAAGAGLTVWLLGRERETVLGPENLR